MFDQVAEIQRSGKAACVFDEPGNVRVMSRSAFLDEAPCVPLLSEYIVQRALVQS